MARSLEFRLGTMLCALRHRKPARRVIVARTLGQRLRRARFMLLALIGMGV